MSEIPKAYEPQSVEDKWYDFWVNHGCFTADPSRVNERRPAYAIVIPPPNVTGMLHMGHVLNNTIQDILARKARMDGKEVLWLPGTDHAGIATQVQVEKALKKEEKKTRHDLGREAFLERVWAWKEKHGGIIIKQLRKLGASCDWTRERFTMDPEYSRCVQKVFVDLHRKGLVYRGKRMVNWCPVSQTALSDEEVEMEAQSGFLYHFQVEIAELPGTFLTVATTRPETIPGDTAIAVNPKDPRYQRFVGLHAIRPLPTELPTEQKRIPIVADDHVEFEFGTGVLKVTPAHDKADFEIGQRHGLPIRDIFDADATVNDLGGRDLAGMERFAARKKAVELLQALGALVKEEPHENKVGFSQRARVPIEPRLSEQWFLRYPSVPASQECVAGGKLRFHPERWAKVYDHWLAHLQDWCISRQLWWGHRIPVWYRKQPTGDPARDLHVDVTPPADAEAWVQDPDVLDTWFSSWLWPFATMGWPEGTPTLRAFYPTTDLVTGPDIIFFWVARMIMAGYEFMGDLPFRNVYFTGIIRDKQGRKMSKTLGNSPDPLELIAKYGADALRFGTMRGAPLGQDVLFDEKDVELGRNFCNKLWNACRFRQMQGGEVQAEIQPEFLSSDDRWILLRLDQAIREIDAAFETYRFNEIAHTLYRFFWNEYCDWYVEACKATFSGDDAARKRTALAVIDFVLSHMLRLFHPYLPFISEELWQGLGYSLDMPADQGGRTLMTAPWPKPLGEEKEAWGLDETADRVAAAKYELVSLGRNLRVRFAIPANKKVRFVFRPAAELDPAEGAVLKTLLNAEALDRVDRDWKPDQGTPVASNALGDLFLPLAGLVDAAAERARLGKELEKIRAEIAKVREKLTNPAFTQKVPPKVLEEHRQREGDWQTKERQILQALTDLPG